MVKARFNFKQNNEDELSFNKGDMILVTRQEEGGWWEGTLNGKTGWFPSNYVREVKPCGESGCMIIYAICFSQRFGMMMPLFLNCSRKAVVFKHQMSISVWIFNTIVFVLTMILNLF